MKYIKKKGFRYIGKLQSKVLSALLDKPLTRIAIIEKTKMSSNNVSEGLKGLMLKGYVEKEGITFKAVEIQKIEDKPLTKKPNGSSTPYNGLLRCSSYSWALDQAKVSKISNQTSDIIR